MTGPSVQDKHPILHHYTSAHGIEGIVRSQSLWATHYRSLNDLNEVVQLREPLIDAILPRARAVVWEHFLKESFKAVILKHGGVEKVARHEAESVIDTVYDVTFKGGTTGEPFADPYIVSFCTHQNEDYEMENGLLSQWRSYAEGSGFAIIFRTHELFELLQEETNRYAHNGGLIA